MPTPVHCGIPCPQKPTPTKTLGRTRPTSGFLSRVKPSTPWIHGFATRVDRWDDGVATCKYAGSQLTDQRAHRPLGLDSNLAQARESLAQEAAQVCTHHVAERSIVGGADGGAWLERTCAAEAP